MKEVQSVSPRARAAGVAALCGFAAASFGFSMILGNYATDFEGISASSTGVVLTGQDGYVLPASSVDFLAYTYAGNSLAVPQHPDGSAQFVAGLGPGGTVFARAQRVVGDYPNLARISYDLCASYEGTLPAANNIGSFSTQPMPNPASPTIKGWIHLASWEDPATAAAWQCLYLFYDAAGVQFPQPGAEAGPEWSNLLPDRWYRFETLVDFTANQALEVSVTDLTTNVTATVDVSGLGWYVGGGSASVLPVPSEFRMFGGSATAGMCSSWDNVSIAPEDTGGPLCMEAGDWTNNSTETGTVADTCDSDDVRTAARRGTFTPAATSLLRYDASTTYSGLGGVTSITVSAECSISNAGVTNVTGRLQIKNQTSGLYATVGSTLLSATDVVISGSPAGDPNAFIGANGEVEVRLIFQQTSGGPNWDGRIDQLTVDIQ